MAPTPPRRGRSIALYGDSGSGKTTQGGELAKAHYKRHKKRTLYHAADYGGHGSIEPLVEVGIIDVNTIKPDTDPWIWLNQAASGHGLTEEHGLVIFDSATSSAEALLNAAAKSPQQVGQQKTQKFKVSGPSGNLVVGLNNEAHYGLVQTFMLDEIWRSTWLTERGVDVLWTFGTHRGESVEAEPIVGPKLAGKALTAAIPKWFNNTFRIVQIPVMGSAPRHVLYLQAQPGHTGSAVSFGNSRYPIDATTELPAAIEPASLDRALQLIDAGRGEAVDNLRAELGL